MLKEGFPYSGEVYLTGDVLRFYESEQVKSAIMRAQKQIVGEGAILVERAKEKGVKITVVCPKREIAECVGTALLLEIRTALQEDPLFEKSGR